MTLIKIQEKMEEDGKKMSKEIKKLKMELSEQTAVNKRLSTLLEKQEYKNHNSNHDVSTMLPDIKPFRHTVTHKYTNKSYQKLKGFGWGLYHDLIKVYRKNKNMQPLSEEEIDTRVSNLKKEVEKVVEEFKLKNKIKSSTTWKEIKPYYYTLYTSLEEQVGALVPLKACENHWGAHMALAKKWQNVQQGHMAKEKKNQLHDGIKFFFIYIIFLFLLFWLTYYAHYN